MGGRKGNPDPALQTCVTGAFIPPAEGGTAFFSPRLPPLFFFTRILAFFSPSMDNGIRDRNRDFERRHNHEGIGIFGEVTVEDSTPARDFYFDGSWSGLTENIIVDTAESITINDNTTGKVSFKVTPAQANNEDLTFHVSEPYQNLVELTYDSSTSILTVKTGVFTQKATVTFTVESPHLDPEVSTPTFTINVNPSSSVTIDSLFGTYSQSEEQDSLISKNSAHKVTLTSETGQQDGYTWYVGTVTDGTVTKEFYYRLDNSNQLVATIIGDSYTDEGYESVRIMYDYETGEIGLIYWIEVWGGMDSVTTTYIVGNDDGDYDYLTYIYEMFTKDIA